MTSRTRELLVCDTSFVSTFLGAAKRPLAGNSSTTTLTRRVGRATAAISVVTIAEMRFGQARARWGIRRQREVEHLLRGLVHFPIDRGVAETWARLKVSGERRGLVFGVNDLWIAATGHARGAVIVTCDRDFLPLRELGVKVVYVPRRPLGQRSG